VCECVCLRWRCGQQYLHGSRGSGFPTVPSRVCGVCGGRGVRDCPPLLCSGFINGCVGGSSGVSIIATIWRRSANVLERCSRMCVRYPLCINSTIVCTNCGSASTGTCPLLIRLASWFLSVKNSVSDYVGDCQTDTISVCSRDCML
jgi:hypothetical protein